MLNAQLPLSCIAALSYNTQSECRTYCSNTKHLFPIPQTRWCLICSLPFTCIWHTQLLSKTECNSARQTVIWCTAMSYLQSLLDNTCPRSQHGRFSETCQIPNQLLPSDLKLLRYLLSSVASKTWFGHPKSKLTQDYLCNLLHN